MPSDPERFLCIGDIHGCLQQLDELLEEVERAQLFNVTFVFLGDYIDRGPDSPGVIDRVRSFPDAICLRGNHEEMFCNALAALESVAQRPGAAGAEGAERLQTFLAGRGYSAEQVDWLKHGLRSSYETDRFFFCHAGLSLVRPLDEQRESDLLWSLHEGDYFAVTDKLVVHGHDSVPRVAIQGNNVNVDTGCGKGGKLSAILLPEMRIFESRSAGGSRRRW